MALGARSAQQAPLGRSLCQPPQARIYRSLPNAAEASRGEPSPWSSPAHPRGPPGVPARPLRAWRIYCTSRPRGALCKRWNRPWWRRGVPRDTCPLPPGQCATPWTKRVLKPRRARPLLRDGKPWQSSAAARRRMVRIPGCSGRKGTRKNLFFLLFFPPLSPVRSAPKNGCRRATKCRGDER